MKREDNSWAMIQGDNLEKKYENVNAFVVSADKYGENKEQKQCGAAIK